MHLSFQFCSAAKLIIDHDTLDPSGQKIMADHTVTDNNQSFLVGNLGLNLLGDLANLKKVQKRRPAEMNGYSLRKRN